MMDRCDPDYWRFRYEKKAYYDQLYQAGKILDTTYLVSMQIAGFSPREAKDELRLLQLTAMDLRRVRSAKPLPRSVLPPDLFPDVRKKVARSALP